METPKVYKMVRNGQVEGWAVEFPNGLVALSSGPSVTVHGNMINVSHYEKPCEFQRVFNPIPTPAPTPEPTYRIGDVFKQNSFSDDGGYILAQVNDGQCCLVSLTDGNRFTNPVGVGDVNKITARELRKMWGRTGEFTRVKKV